MISGQVVKISLPTRLRLAADGMPTDMRMTALVLTFRENGIHRDDVGMAVDIDPATSEVDLTLEMPEQGDRQVLMVIGTRGGAEVPYDQLPKVTATIDDGSIQYTWTPTGSVNKVTIILETYIRDNQILMCAANMGYVEGWSSLCRQSRCDLDLTSILDETLAELQKTNIPTRSDSTRQDPEAALTNHTTTSARVTERASRRPPLGNRGECILQTDNKYQEVRDMDLSEQLREIQKMALEHREVLVTEEAAKTALIMPLIRALGYNVFNPFEVKPEFTADVGVKKGEKVDYAICNGDAVDMLIECKDTSISLDPKRFPKHFTQLFRYFSVTTARIAVLTNGIEYRFFSDIVKPNIMDEEPFYVFNLLAIRPEDVRILGKFAKDAFNVTKLVAEATEMRTQTLVRAAIASELEKPSDEFIKIIAGKVQEGRFTQGVRDIFGSLIPAMATSLIQEKVTKRLEQALSTSAPTNDDATSIAATDEEAIITTQEEIDGFHVVRAICARHVDPARVIMRDAKSYCAILLDDNNRKSIVRMHFNHHTNKWLGTFSGKDEIKTPIAGPKGIYSLERLIVDRLKELDPAAFSLAD